MNKPYLYKESLSLGNPESNVAVVTLWTKKEGLIRQLDLSDVAVVGQLYSSGQGINALIRNCLLNKRIRYLVVTGEDLSGGGEALKCFFANGVDDQGRIKGTDETYVDAQLGPDAIERLRQHVTLLDRRDVQDYNALCEEIRSLESLPSYGDPEEFPQDKPRPPFTAPSEISGFRVGAAYIGEAWLQALRVVLRFGTLKESQQHEDQKEVLNMVVNITEEDPDDPEWKDYYEFTPQELEGYIPQVTTAQEMQGVEYTYGQRLRDHKGIDQISCMIDQLTKSSYTRRAIAFTWDVRTDCENPCSPCLNLVQAIIQGGKLHLTAYLRSNDMYRAWPQNAYALRKLQKDIARQVGVSMGILTTISNSAHIYASMWERAQTLLDTYYPETFTQDPRGSFSIRVHAGQILLSHLDTAGQEIERLHGSSAQEITQQLSRNMHVSDIYHAMYLGRELEKAERALQQGRSYIQDEPLDHESDDWDVPSKGVDVSST